MDSAPVRGLSQKKSFCCYYRKSYLRTLFKRSQSIAFPFYMFENLREYKYDAVNLSPADAVYAARNEYCFH